MIRGAALALYVSNPLLDRPMWLQRLVQAIEDASSAAAAAPTVSPLCLYQLERALAIAHRLPEATHEELAERLGLLRAILKGLIVEVGQPPLPNGMRARPTMDLPVPRR